MIIIGDVHGCYKTLMALIDKLPKEQKICFVGDLVDRGPENKKVLDFVMSNFHDCVMGNHEEMMIYDRQMWACNGGLITYNEFENDDELKIYVEYLKLLPYYKIYPDCIDKNGRKLLVCHGGLCDEDLDFNVRNGTITWLRSDWVNHPEYFQVVGHTPVKEPLIKDYMANIDTGCVFGTSKTPMKLTALQFPEMIVYQQINIDF